MIVLVKVPTHTQRKTETHNPKHPPIISFLFFYCKTEDTKHTLPFQNIEISITPEESINHAEPHIAHNILYVSNPHRELATDSSVLLRFLVSFSSFKKNLFLQLNCSDSLQLFHAQHQTADRHSEWWAGGHGGTFSSQRDRYFSGVGGEQKLS